MIKQTRTARQVPEIESRQGKIEADLKAVGDVICCVEEQVVLLTTRLAPVQQPACNAVTEREPTHPEGVRSPVSEVLSSFRHRLLSAVTDLNDLVERLEV